MQREPTRGRNLLDLFCCNKPSLVKSCTSIPGVSDHGIVLADCSLKALIIKTPPRKVYQWSKADWPKVKEHTVKFAKQFLAEAKTRTVNDNYIALKKFMEELLTNSIPSKLSSTRHNLPWFNKKFKNLTNIKGRRYTKAKKSGLDVDWDDFYSFEKIVKYKLKAAEQDYLERTLRTGLESKNTKPFWKYIKSRKQESFGISALKSNGNTYRQSI